MEINITLDSFTDRQREIITDIINTDAMLYTIVSSRQSGKTEALIRLMAYFAFSESNTEILAAAPTFKQIRPIRRKFGNLISGIKKQYKEFIVKENQNEIRFSNGSYVLFRTTKIPDNLRGESYKYVFLDEFAYMPEGLVHEQISPTTGARPGAKIIMASTPKGKMNDFFKFFDMGCNLSECTNQTPDARSYRMHYTDNVINGVKNYNMKVINLAKDSSPRGLYLAEYEGKFLDATSDVFGDYSSVCTVDNYYEPDQNETYYAAIDWGVSNDNSVLFIIDSKGAIVCHYAPPLLKTTSDGDMVPRTTLEQITDLLFYLELFQPILYAEINGIGQNYVSELNNHYPVHNFTMTNASKRKIVSTLIYNINNRTIQLPSSNLCPQLHIQMSDYTMYTSDIGTVTYKGRKNKHDDYVTALCIAVYALSLNQGEFSLPVYSRKK